MFIPQFPWQRLPMEKRRFSGLVATRQERGIRRRIRSDQLRKAKNQTCGARFSEEALVFRPTVAVVITAPPGGYAAMGGVAAGGSMDERREHLSSRPRPPAFLAWRLFNGKQALALASPGLNSAGGTLCAGTDQLWPNQKSL